MGELLFGVSARRDAHIPLAFVLSVILGAPMSARKATVTLGMFGDWPYGNVISTAPSFIAQVNADPDVEQLLHVGDYDCIR